MLIQNKSISIETFLRRYNLPKRVLTAEFNILVEYEKIYKAFINDFELCDGSEYTEPNSSKAREMLLSIKDNIEKGFNAVIKILQYHNKQDLMNAQSTLDTLMNSLKHDFITGTPDDLYDFRDNTCYIGLRDWRKQEFFRVRPVDNFDDKKFKNPDELLHISLYNRSLSANGRFGLAGFPSLYLSSMRLLAWQECGYPPKCYYSKFKYKQAFLDNTPRVESDELFLLNMYSPREIIDWGVREDEHFDTRLAIISKYLKTYPLVLACSFVNVNDSTPFNQEYIISQMLMQWVARNYDEVKGISYFSCHDNTLITGGLNAYNIALPVPILSDVDENGYSNLLRHHFQQEAPVRYYIPITDKTKNTNDRYMLKLFSEETKNFLRTIDFPANSNILNYTYDMGRLTDSLYILLDINENTDMRLFLHMLNSLEMNYKKMAEISIESLLIDKNNGKNDIYYNEDTRSSFVVLYNKFHKSICNNAGIERLLHKYWNDLWKF